MCGPGFVNVNVTTRAITLGLVAFGLLAVNPAAEAVLVSTSGRLVFYDGFENTPVGSASRTNDPVVGSWEATTLPSGTRSEVLGSGSYHPLNSFIIDRQSNPGGANFAFADGHVSFLSETINQDTLVKLTTRDGGETIQDTEY